MEAADRGRGRGRGRGRPQGDQPPQARAGLSTAMGAMRVADDEPRGLGRGSTRGVRREANRFDLVRSRPQTLESKKGTGGREIALVTNYFSFEMLHGSRLMQYRVDLSLEEDRTFVRKAILGRCKEKLPPAYIFDGTMLMTMQPVYPHGQKKELRVTSAREDRQAGTSEPCDVVIKLVAELHPTDHHYIQFQNMVLRRSEEKMGLTLLGRHHFDSNSVVKFPAGRLEVWPGYVTSIRQHESNVLLCADVLSKVVRTETALDQLRMVVRNGDPKKALLGAVVMTRYNNKTYRVDDVDFKSNPLSTFSMKDGSQMTYAEYYRNKYQAHIKDLKQPLLVSMPKERDRRGGRDQKVMLVPELCHMTGLTDEHRSNFNLMKAMGEYTRLAPPKRTETLLAFARTFTQNQECRSELERWGMKLNPKMLELTGRVLTQENIFMKDSKTVTYDPNRGDWTKGFQSHGLFAPTPIRKWICVFPRNDAQRMGTFWKTMQSVMPGLGLFCDAPDRIEVPDVRTDTYTRALRECVQKNPNFILVVIPNDKGDHYATCKKLLCIENPVPSQFITASKVLSKDPTKQKSIATKVLVQMTTKLGGAPWTVKIPFKVPIMVVGFDTYHDEAARGHSVGALVASLDNACTRYFSIAQPHVPKQEISSCVPNLLTLALRRYWETRKELPKKIFFFRDGVGDGQLQVVYDNELEAVKKIFPTLQEDYNPDFTFVVVSKRINTRFFGRGASNPPCGTVVDDVVTLPERYDFFLVPQSVNQGTVNPTSFNVLHDTSGLKPEHIQQLTYKLCHLYYNWAGTVRVPAPCQYAHKLAFLVGTSLHAAPSPHLADLLFYL